MPTGAAWELDIEGEQAAFCCPGCREVCRSILETGLGDYYRLRNRPAPAVPSGKPSDFHLYDDPQLQASFVTAGENWQEAALILEEIRCPACLWLNAQRLRGLDGVLAVHADYSSQRIRVRWDRVRLSLSDILRAIARLGYRAEPYDPAHRQALAAEQKRRSLERLLFAGATGMAIMHFSLAAYLMPAADPLSELPLWVLIGRWTSFIVTTAILAFAGQDFFLGAFDDLRNRRLGMDVPIALGLLVAYFGSLVATVRQQGEVFYDSIAMFVCLVLTARHLELRARLLAADTVDRLARVVPKTAQRLHLDGQSEPIFIFELRPGDRVRVDPGQRVPVDGRIVEGQSRFDESLLTGEALPVDRGPGEAVIGGAQNWDQPVTIEVTCIPQDSILTQLSRLLEKSLAHKPRYACLADRLAGWLVAAIIGVAGATATTWLWLEPTVALANTVSVLIATCPCALALATPVVMAIGARRFVELGVLPLRMSIIEPLAHTAIWAFDKTGTLTVGRPELRAVEPFGSLDAPTALRIAATLEHASTHPIARALQTACPECTLYPDNPRHVPSAGVRGEINGQTWWLGRSSWVQASAPHSEAVSASLQGPKACDELVVELANGDGAQAVFRLADSHRPGIPLLLKELRQQGAKRLVVLSGDSQQRVSRFGAELGFDEALGDCLPQDKLAWIRAQQRDGHRVFMVGDGINDAPTLAAADVGLAFREATDLAQSASDLLLLSQDIGVIAKLTPLAKRVRRILIQNLFWAGGYNLLMVPAAAAGWIPPWGAALGMSLSSLLVVGNALRLHKPQSATEGSGSLSPAKNDI